MNYDNIVKHRLPADARQSIMRLWNRFLSRPSQYDSGPVLEEIARIRAGRKRRVAPPSLAIKACAAATDASGVTERRKG